MSEDAPDGWVLPSSKRWEAWQERRRRNVRAVALLLGIIPWVPLCFWVATSLRHERLATVMIAAYLFMVLVPLSFYPDSWRCPRCGRFFNGPIWLRHAVVVRKCYYCGLPNGAVTDSNRWNASA